MIAMGLAALIVSAAIGRDGITAKADKALQQVARDPLDTAVLRTLGLRLDHEGRTAQADAVLSLVGRRTWLDGPTEAWLFRTRLRAGRFTEAFESADSLLRRDGQGELRPALFPVLRAAAHYSEARPALVTRLEAAPWWRTDFLQDLALRGDVDGARLVMATLSAGKAPPNPAEYAPLINRMVNAGTYRAALQAWREIARPEGDAAALLRDGDFAGTSDQTDFTWSVADGVGGSSETGSAPDGSGGRALRVDYDGYASPRLPAQLLVAPPGRYRVTWREQGDVRRLAWRVRCVGSGRILARADEGAVSLSQPSRWNDMAMTFEPATAGCDAQWLELAAIAGERRNPVTGWYERLRVAPAGQ